MLASAAIFLSVYVCAIASGDVPPVDRNCRDVFKTCSLIESLCTTREDHMKRMCALTCGFCRLPGSDAKKVTRAPVTKAPCKPGTKAPAIPATKAPAKPATKAPQISGSLSCSGTKMTPTLRASVLDKHNFLRSRIARGQEDMGGKKGMAPGAKNMYKLSYDCELEKAAQKWADTCPDYTVKAHSAASGENMHFSWSSGAITPEYLLERGTQGWWGELQQKGMQDKNFRYTIPVANSGVGHFTAMAWGRTTRLGCATATNCKSRGMNMGVLCCQYLVGGNMRNAPIYELGSACKKNADCTTFGGSKCETATGLCVAP